MFDHVADIHWPGVVVATVAFAALGGLYFAVLVPKLYAYAIGRENQPVEPTGGVLFYAGPLLCVLVNAAVLADGRPVIPRRVSVGKALTATGERPGTK